MFSLIFSFIFSFFLLINVSAARNVTINSAKQVYTSGSDLNIALILHKCENFTTQTQLSRQSLMVNSAIWTIQRINYLELSPLEFGISIHETCSLHDDLSTTFHLYEDQNQNENRNLLIGVISDNTKEYLLHSSLSKFCEILQVPLKTVSKSNTFLIKAAVTLVTALGWNQITIVVPNQLLLREFFEESKQNFVCIQEFLLYDTTSVISVSNASSNIVLFGHHAHLNQFLENYNKIDANLLLIPLDGLIINDLPPSSYIILPPYSPAPFNFSKPASFFPSPLLFEVGLPISNFAQNIAELIIENCNETTTNNKTKKSDIKNCIWNYSKKIRDDPLDFYKNPSEFIDFLKIEPLKENFVYNIYKSENFTYTKAFQYKVFSDSLTSLVLNDDINKTDNVDNRTYNNCECKNFISQIDNLMIFNGGLKFRWSESWTFAFLSLSLLGIIFCIAIFIFLIISLCRKDILEGNPVLTFILLLVIILMYLSIIPLSLDADKSSFKEVICLVRTFSISLTFAAAFSLILSRSILLAGTTKDIGILSHIAGPVQSFLCLFIFGVQAALNLQVTTRCTDIYHGFSLIYLLSYNAMLLLLLLCLGPLTFKSQRNYREGKYFTIAAILISIMWSFWLPSYAIFGDKFKDPILAFGVFSTASVLVGVIFVPRTYLMTIASARNKITSNILPSTSALDIYRVGAQPIYDCVNVEAINTLAISRNRYNNGQQPDLYSFPTMPDDDNNFENTLPCESSVNDDKVTRF